MEDTLIHLFCLVDEFCHFFIPEWQKHLLINRLMKRRRKTQLSPSEIMTIYIHFHQSHYRDFKNYYIFYVQKHLKHLFPDLVSYPRFVTLIKSVIVPLCFFLQILKGEETGIYFVDSLLLKACHIKRENQHKVFKGVAKKSKSSIGWFFGFKLHLVINDKGELMAFKVTAGNVDDRKPVMDLTKKLIGKLFGDKGYISKKLSEELFSKGIRLITRVKKNMKNKFLPLIDKLLLRKRAVIESVNDQLKNICQIEHSRHRSIWNFTANILAALCAYSKVTPMSRPLSQNFLGDFSPF
jgi:Transposase DDE domain